MMEDFQADSSDEVVISKQNVGEKIAHSSETLISDSKYLGWGDLEVLMGEQQNGHWFSFFFLTP